MNNQTICITKEQEKEFIKKYILKNYYIAKIDGSNIQTLNDYMNAIIIAFQFPKGMFTNTNSIDAYNDWMRDLTWIDQYDGYILVIENFELMMSSYPKEKGIILEEFEETIYPFWKNEVLHTVVDGKAKGFFVFLID